MWDLFPATNSPLPPPRVPGSGSSDKKKCDLKHASYGVPPHLSRILVQHCLRGAAGAGTASAAGSGTDGDAPFRADATVALSGILSNAFRAIDAVYFSTPSAVRERPSWRHRTLVRIDPDASAKTLSVTDLGCGMTRADLINCLGVGPTGGGGETGPGSGDDDGSSGLLLLRPPELQNVVGSFYSALCVLATGVNIGTKSKCDDYYEFELGLTDRSDSSPFRTFSIVRPLGEEKTKPSTNNGCNRFRDVRGESGTRVTFYLSDDAVRHGMLDEEVIGRCIAGECEKTQYGVLFSSDPEAPALSGPAEEEDDGPGAAAEEDATADMCDDGGDDGPHDASPPARLPVRERARYIPVRLVLPERKMLRLVESVVACSDYTSMVDVRYPRRNRRAHVQLGLIGNILRGMVTACDYKAGQGLLDDNDYSQYDSFYRQMFEIARRHKIMNPEKMRTEYGKLIYFLQDVVSPTIRPLLSFSCRKEILTVYRFLEERDGLAMLDSKYIQVATEEILGRHKSRALIDVEIRQKEAAVEVLKKTYCSPTLSAADIHLCLYSICDNNSFLNSNRVPIDRAIEYLQRYFHPTVVDPHYSLSIRAGKDGARLTHGHERQYHFALQSLTLWREIVDDMFRLWHAAEEDLLSGTVTYSLRDTGQGMQRVQQSPRTYRAMQQILVRVQKKVRTWIGSSVVHLGDHNVPNALMFIDKYTQVPQILGPIINCLDNLEHLYSKDDSIQKYIDDGYGGLETVKKDILYDFFKSAFDGSGADNFYDAGSCIDGRLTSAWNWCSQLHLKPYFSVFRLTGFSGFDGKF